MYNVCTSTLTHIHENIYLLIDAYAALDTHAHKAREREKASARGRDNNRHNIKWETRRERIRCNRIGNTNVEQMDLIRK